MDVIKLAIATVGVTQIIKNLIPEGKGNKVVWTLVALIVGTVIGLIQRYTQANLDIVIGVTGATLFYDTIYKRFERMFRE